MSRYSDINQLIEEIGTSARSASDPWTLSRSYHGAVTRDSFSPAVIADIGATGQELTSGIQSSEEITNADIVASSPTGGSGADSSSTGLLGGLLNFFPLASGIAKLFGLGGSSSPPALTPYQLPPSINFEGAVSNATSGVTSLSYGADGLPRASGATPAPTTIVNRPPPSNFDLGPIETAANLSGATNAGTNSPGIPGQPGLLAISDITRQANTMPGNTEATNGSSAASPDVVTQLAALANSALSTDVDATNSTFNSGLISTSVQNSDANSLAFQQSFAGNSTTNSADRPAAARDTSPGASSTSSQQGQSILVQVQAMDSQSFMDHSQEIAQAVRQAMLNMNSLNDVILDL